jgi:hypothetical protein
VLPWFAALPSPLDSCSMLSVNDKWFMIYLESWNKEHFGQAWQQGLSLVPPEIAGINMQEIVSRTKDARFSRAAH